MTAPILPTRAQRSEALRRLQAWLLNKPIDFAQQLHWLTHAETLSLETLAHIDAWQAVLTTFNAPSQQSQRDQLQRDLGQLVALQQQLRGTWHSRAGQLLKANQAAELEPWREWLRLLLAGGDAAQPNRQRAAQLATLLSAYRRQHTQS